MVQHTPTRLAGRDRAQPGYGPDTSANVFGKGNERNPMNFIITHPIIAIIAVFLILLLLVLFVGGLLRSAGMHDEPLSIIEPQDLIDDEHPCAWCQHEQAIKAQPNESHGICKRHAATLIEDARRINRAA
jgi:hypothetical protein